MKAALAALEQELAALDQRRTLVSAALDALRARASGAGGATAKAVSTKKPVATSPATGGPSRPRGLSLTTAQAAQGRKLWVAGVAVGEIRQTLGLKNDGAVYYVSKRESWPARQKRTSPKSKPAAAKSATPKRRCEGCSQITATDPCACGHRWKP